mgnify:CR=1 FL=1
MSDLATSAEHEPDPSGPVGPAAVSLVRSKQRVADHGEGQQAVQTRRAAGGEPALEGQVELLEGVGVLVPGLEEVGHQGTQTAYEIDLFGRKLEVLELGTAARHQVGVETQVSLPRESCWAYRDTGPSSLE